MPGLMNSQDTACNIFGQEDAVARESTGLPSVALRLNSAESLRASSGPVAGPYVVPLLALGSRARILVIDPVARLQCTENRGMSDSARRLQCTSRLIQGSS